MCRLSLSHNEREASLELQITKNSKKRRNDGYLVSVCLKFIAFDNITLFMGFSEAHSSFCIDLVSLIFQYRRVGIWIVAMGKNGIWIQNALCLNAQRAMF